MLGTGLGLCASHPLPSCPLPSAAPRTWQVPRPGCRHGPRPCWRAAGRRPACCRLRRPPRTRRPLAYHHPAAATEGTTCAKPQQGRGVRRSESDVVRWRKQTRSAYACPRRATHCNGSRRSGPSHAHDAQAAGGRLPDADDAHGAHLESPRRLAALSIKAIVASACAAGSGCRAPSSSSSNASAVSCSSQPSCCRCAAPRAPRCCCAAAAAAALLWGTGGRAPAPSMARWDAVRPLAAGAGPAAGA